MVCARPTGRSRQPGFIETIKSNDHALAPPNYAAAARRCILLLQSLTQAWAGAVRRVGGRPIHLNGGEPAMRNETIPSILRLVRVFPARYSDFAGAIFWWALRSIIDDRRSFRF